MIQKQSIDNTKKLCTFMYKEFNEKSNFDTLRYKAYKI